MSPDSKADKGKRKAYAKGKAMNMSFDDAGHIGTPLRLNQEKLSIPKRNSDANLSNQSAAFSKIKELMSD